MSRNVIPEIFLESAEKNEEKIAFNYFDTEWKRIAYSELIKSVKSIASFLINTGIEKGDRIAICSENRPEWGMSYLGLSLAGCIGVPIDVQLGHNEIKNLLEDSQSKIIFHSSKTADNVKKAIEEHGENQKLKILSINFDLSLFKEILNTPVRSKFPDIDEDDIASIIYTSGTTGRPKGVMLSHRNFCSDAKALMNIGILSNKDSVISVLPLHHTYPFLGNCILPVFLGIPVSFPPSLKGPDIMETMKQFNVTVLVSVPQLLELIRNGILNKIKQLKSPLPNIMLAMLNISGKLRRKYDINPGKIIFSSVHKSFGKSFRFSACGGAKLDTQVMKDLEAIGLTILEGYGLTETSPVVSFNPIEKRKPGSVGVVLPSAEVKIVDPVTDKEKGLMEEGEIIIKGPMVMKGYYKNPEATEQVLKNGWFHSGDLGYFDDEGYLFITGRIKEVIVLSSGKNIYPEEVEKQYQRIPLIKEICVLGIEKNAMTESLQAVIVPDFEYAGKNKISNIREALNREIAKLSTELPSYMTLKGFTLYNEPLPRTPLGKLRRFMVKDFIKQSVLKESVSEELYMPEDETDIKIIECLESLQKEKIPINITHSLELDLGLDSLSKLELIAMLEKVFMIKLPDTFLIGVQTVEELISKVKEYSTGKSSSLKKLPEWKEILSSEPSFEDRKNIGFHHNIFEKLVLFSGLQLVKAIATIFFRLRVKGIENIPSKFPFIIAPNHVSYLDAFIIASALPFNIFKNVYSLGIQKYFANKAGKIFARLANVIPIDQELYLTKALQLSAYVLKNRKSLLVFPEGSRSVNGDLMEFKKGVGILSVEMNIPVVPAYIKGTFQALPRGAGIPKFKKVEVIFGKPMIPGEIDISARPEGIDRYQYFANLLKKEVEKLKFFATSKLF